MDLLRLIKRPIVTEKTTRMAAFNQYVFEVVDGANKIELAKAFEAAFEGRKVTAVRLVRIPEKSRRLGRRQIKTAAKQKAIFTITGEPLELMAGV
jgi:large subunit ribosomal protein L23